MDRQISFPLSNVLLANGEKNGQPALHDFTEDIQFMDIEETSGNWTYIVLAGLVMLLDAQEVSTPSVVDISLKKNLNYIFNL